MKGDIKRHNYYSYLSLQCQPVYSSEFWVWAMVDLELDWYKIISRQSVMKTFLLDTSNYLRQQVSLSAQFNKSHYKP